MDIRLRTGLAYSIEIIRVEDADQDGVLIFDVNQRKMIGTLPYVEMRIRSGVAYSIFVLSVVYRIDAKHSLNIEKSNLEMSSNNKCRIIK